MMKKLLILLVGISFTMPLAAKKILTYEKCNEDGRCVRSYRLTGEDVIPYVEPSEEQKSRKHLENEVKRYRETHPEAIFHTDKEVAVQMLKEMIEKP